MEVHTIMGNLPYRLFIPNGCDVLVVLVPFQVTSVFEDFHQGRILCAAVASEHTLLTGGDSTVRPCVSCGTHSPIFLSEDPLFNGLVPRLHTATVHGGGGGGATLQLT